MAVGKPDDKNRLFIICWAFLKILISIVVYSEQSRLYWYRKLLIRLRSNHIVLVDEKDMYCTEMLKCLVCFQFLHISSTILMEISNEFSRTHTCKSAHHFATNSQANHDTQIFCQWPVSHHHNSSSHIWWVCNVSQLQRDPTIEMDLDLMPFSFLPLYRRRWRSLACFPQSCHRSSRWRNVFYPPARRRWFKL